MWHANELVPSPCVMITAHVRRPCRPSYYFLWQKNFHHSRHRRNHTHTKILLTYLKRKKKDKARASLCHDMIYTINKSIPCRPSSSSGLLETTLLALYSTLAVSPFFWDIFFLGCRGGLPVCVHHHHHHHRPTCITQLFIDFVICISTSLGPKQPTFWRHM